LTKCLQSLEEELATFTCKFALWASSSQCIFCFIPPRYFFLCLLSCSHQMQLFWI